MGLVEKAILVVGTTETKTQKINKISFKSEKYMLTWPLFWKVSKTPKKPFSWAQLDAFWSEDARGDWVLAKLHQIEIIPNTILRKTVGMTLTKAHVFARNLGELQLVPLESDQESKELGRRSQKSSWPLREAGLLVSSGRRFSPSQKRVFEVGVVLIFFAPPGIESQHHS